MVTRGGVQAHRVRTAASKERVSHQSLLPDVRKRVGLALTRESVQLGAQVLLSQILVQLRIQRVQAFVHQLFAGK